MPAADITRAANVSIANVSPAPTLRNTGHLAGEDLEPGAACFIDSDNLIWNSKADADATSDVHGFVVNKARVAQGDAVTLVKGLKLYYGSGLTPGARLYLSAATKGKLCDAPTAGAYNLNPVGYVDNDQVIWVNEVTYGVLVPGP